MITRLQPNLQLVLLMYVVVLLMFRERLKQKALPSTTPTQEPKTFEQDGLSPSKIHFIRLQAGGLPEEEWPPTKELNWDGEGEFPSFIREQAC